MKGRFIVPAFLAFVVTTACNKENIYSGSQRNQGGNESLQPEQLSSAAYVSGWETVFFEDMKRDSESFSHTLSLPSSLKTERESTVLVFARNLWANDPLYATEGGDEEPIVLPFYFLPFHEEPGYTELWNYKTEGHKVEVSLTVKGINQKIIQPKKVQLCYVVVPPKILSKKNQTAGDLRQLSYKQVMQILGRSS